MRMNIRHRDRGAREIIDRRPARTDMWFPFRAALAIGTMPIVEDGFNR